MKRPLTDHEFQINGGAWIACAGGNTADNGDGTYTINSGLDIDIPIGGLKVRVKSIGTNPASSELSNTVAFNGAATPKVIQLFALGDSITRGIGTTGSGFATGSGVYGGAYSWPQQALAGLSDLDVTLFQRGWSGQTTGWFINNDLQRTIALFDKTNYTDIYCVLYFGTNDLVSTEAVDIEANVTSVCTALKAAGAKVLLVTPLDQQNAGLNPVLYNSRRADYHTWLVANASTVADGLVDLSVYPEIYDVGAANDTTYFADAAHDVSGAGKLHPTDAGAALIAEGVVNAVTTLSATSSLPLDEPDDAANFIAATGITDSTIIAAINTFVTDMKAAKLWWRLRAMYPFVGGTAGRHKYNLRNPADTDAAFRLTFSGAPIHDANGVTWDSGAYADTHLLQIGDDFEASNISLHYYSRSNTVGGIDIGAFEGTHPCWFGINNGGELKSQLNHFSGGNGLPWSNYAGLFAASRDNDFQNTEVYRNGVQAGTYAELVQAGAVPGVSFAIGNNNNAFDHPSNRNCAYAAIGYGLTPTEEAAHYTIVQAFQTALSRAV